MPEISAQSVGEGTRLPLRHMVVGPRLRVSIAHGGNHNNDMAESWNRIPAGGDGAARNGVLRAFPGVRGGGAHSPAGRQCDRCGSGDGGDAECVEPYMSGIGGCGYMTIYIAEEKQLCVLDYMGTSAAAADPRTRSRAEMSAALPRSALDAHSGRGGGLADRAGDLRDARPSHRLRAGDRVCRTGRADRDQERLISIARV